ncbi:MAG: sugar phosphate isomerase/epimerase family protein [Gammaproteobacteria bacterium]
MDATRHLNRAGYGIDTYSFTHTLSARDCLEQLADLGYRQFEIMLVPGHFWPSLDGDAGRREIESLIVSNSLRILTLNQPNLDVNLSSVVPEMRQHSCGVIARAIELAAAWNAKGVVINPGKANPVFPAPTKTLTDCFRWSLEVLVPIARRAGVELIVKNHPLSYLYRANDLRLFFDAFGWDQIGIGYDFANGHFAGEEPEAVLQLRDHLSFMYAADTSLDAFHHAQIGTGTVAFDGIAGMLRDANVCLPTILEIVAENPQLAIDACWRGLRSVSFWGWARICW